MKQKDPVQGHSHKSSTDKPVAPDDPAPKEISKAPNTSGSSSETEISLAQQKFPHNLPHVLQLIVGQDGKAYAVMDSEGNAYVLPVGSRALNNIIRGYGRVEGHMLRKSDLNDINAWLQAEAETAGKFRDVYYRIVPISNGVEIDLGDKAHTRILITPGEVSITEQQSKTLFYRTATMRPLTMPADKGDLSRLQKYLNLPAAEALLYIAYVAYVLAHPKVATTNYPILVLFGDQGSGKSTMCRITQSLIDPGIIGVQTLPSNQKDLVIAAQHSHVLFYDNLRSIKPTMADTLCTAATGGYLTTRQLYTDADLQVHNLHCAIVLNGLHAFISQADLAQRTLPLRLKPIDGSNRKSELALIRDFETDLPLIFRGLLDLIADIFIHLPTVQPQSPERMIEFSTWLAAFEKVDDALPGTYQAEYSRSLNEAMLESLQDDALCAAVMVLAENMHGSSWSGTPSELLVALNDLVDRRTQYSRQWPANAISLSKHLQSLQGGLKSQGIDVSFSRGKKRRITITNLEDF
jgi:hypothetical protein